MILPTSRVTSAPSSFLAARSSSPSSRTSSPRRGAGTLRQALNAACARAMTAGMSAGSVSRRRATSAPSIGECTARVPPLRSASVRPAAFSTSLWLISVSFLTACAGRPCGRPAGMFLAMRPQKKA